MCSLGIELTTFALLTQCSNHWATGTYIYIYIYICMCVKKQSPSLCQSQTHLPDCQTNKRGTSLHRNCFYCSRLQWRHALHHFTSMTLGIALGDVKLTSSCFHELQPHSFVLILMAVEGWSYGISKALVSFMHHAPQHSVMVSCYCS